MSATERDAGPGQVRASDADRERVVDQLRRHHEQGRLDGEEFTERMEAALSSRWVDELPRLLVDLPNIDRSDGAEPGTDQARRDQSPWPGAWRPYAPVFAAVVGALVVLAVIGSIVAVANGFFPFPLLWLLFGLFAFKPWMRRRFAEAQRQRQ